MRRGAVSDFPKHVIRDLRETLDALESNLDGASSTKLDRSIEAADEIVRKLKALRHTASFSPREREEEAPRPPAPTINLQKREYVVLALEELGLPASPAMISTFIKQRWHA